MKKKSVENCICAQIRADMFDPIKSNDVRRRHHLHAIYRLNIDNKKQSHYWRRCCEKFQTNSTIAHMH